MDAISPLDGRYAERLAPLRRTLPGEVAEFLAGLEEIDGDAVVHDAL